VATIGAANDPQSFVLTVPDESTPAVPFSGLFTTLANSILAALVRLKNQVQSAVAYSDKISAVTGWEIQFQIITIVGETIGNIHLQLKRTGAPISVPANGDLGNQIVAQIAAGFEARAEAHLGSGDTGRTLAGYTLGDGTIKLSSMNSGAPIATEDVLTFVGMYVLANPVRSNI
jgi:hypothetical protein